MQLNPAEFVIKTFGGVRPLSRNIERSPGTISSWRKSGLIPHKIQRAILMAARRRRLDLTPEDLILGRNIIEENK